MRASALVVVVVCVAGCVASAPFRPVTLQAQGTDAQLYKSAVRVMADSTSGVATNDVNAGVVLSEWDEQGTIGNDKVRFRWRAVVGSGQVRVDSDCQTWTDTPAFTGGQKWVPCEAQGNDRQGEANRLASAIVAAARSLPGEPQPQPVEAPGPSSAAAPAPTGGLIDIE